MVTRNIMINKTQPLESLWSRVRQVKNNLIPYVSRMEKAHGSRSEKVTNCAGGDKRGKRGVRKISTVQATFISRRIYGNGEEITTINAQKQEETSYILGMNTFGYY